MTLPGWALALALLGASSTLDPSFAVSQEGSPARKPAPNQPASKARKKAVAPRRSLDDRLKDVADVPALFVQSGSTEDLVDYVQYNLKLAIRAGYDVDVFVRGVEIRDQKTRLFKVRNGVTSNEPAEYQFERNQTVEVHRYGMLVARTAEQAFTLDLFFFLRDAFIEGGRLRYTIVSNPKYYEASVGGLGAVQLLEKTNRRSGVSTRTLLLPLVIQPNVKPQPRVLAIGDFDDQTTGRVTIVALPRGTQMPYVASNDIDLAAVWKARTK